MSEPRVTYYVDPDEGVWRATDFVGQEGKAITDAVKIVQGFLKSLSYYGDVNDEKRCAYCLVEGHRAEWIHCPVRPAEEWLSRHANEGQS